MIDKKKMKKIIIIVTELAATLALVLALIIIIWNNISIIIDTRLANATRISNLKINNDSNDAYLLYYSD